MGRPLLAFSFPNYKTSPGSPTNCCWQVECDGEGFENVRSENRAETEDEVELGALRGKGSLSGSESPTAGKDNVMPQCKAHPCATPREVRSASGQWGSFPTPQARSRPLSLCLEDVGAISTLTATYLQYGGKYFPSLGLNLPSCKTSSKTG